MDKFNKEYIELLSKDDDLSEKFWKLDERIRKNKRKKEVQLEMPRLDLIYNIISLIKEGAICFEALGEFSDDIKETVKSFLSR